jgi:hypothetical protein
MTWTFCLLIVVARWTDTMCDNYYSRLQNPFVKCFGNWSTEPLIVARSLAHHRHGNLHGFCPKLIVPWNVGVSEVRVSVFVIFLSHCRREL